MAPSLGTPSGLHESVAENEGSTEDTHAADTQNALATSVENQPQASSPVVPSEPSTPTKDQATAPTRTDSVKAAKTPKSDEHIARSISYYDPDLLVDIPASPPTPPVPRVPLKTIAVDEEASDDPDSAGLGAVETLQESDYELDELDAFSTDEELGISRRIRESLRQSQDGTSGSAMDLSLIEKLLAELDDTKEKMKTLQKDYSHMKVWVCVSRGA